jgi:transcriptional regulator NrdR family protein
MPDTPCPNCAAANNGVIETRLSMVDDLHTIRRRRACKACNYRWTTHEFRDEDLEVIRHGSPVLREAREDALNLLYRLSGGKKAIKSNLG